MTAASTSTLHASSSSSSSSGSSSSSSSSKKAGGGGKGGHGGVVSVGSLLYDLYAVLLHTGSLEKGHYFALIKDVEDGAWYRFDDERVTLLSEAQLERELRKAYGGRGSTSAYMLLYKEMDVTELPAPERAAPAAGGASAAAGDPEADPPAEGAAAAKYAEAPAPGAQTV